MEYPDSVVGLSCQLPLLQHLKTTATVAAGISPSLQGFFIFISAKGFLYHIRCNFLRKIFSSIYMNRQNLRNQIDALHAQMQSFGQSRSAAVQKHRHQVERRRKGRYRSLHGTTPFAAVDGAATVSSKVSRAKGESVTGSKQVVKTILGSFTNISTRCKKNTAIGLFSLSQSRPWRSKSWQDKGLTNRSPAMPVLGARELER
jgi:hypothetical protein